MWMGVAFRNNIFPSLVDVQTNFVAFKKNILKMKIPGLSFSLKRAVGITAAKQKIARKTGIPLTKGGLERKIGRALLNGITGKKRK